MRRHRQLVSYLCVLALPWSALVAHAAPAHPLPVRLALGDLTWGMSQTELKRHVEVYDQPSAWNDGFLRRELGHDHGQRMLVSRDPFARSFYLFTAGKLSKIYIVFDALAFPEGNFAAFARALQQRFGPAKQGSGELAPGTQRRWLEWRDGRTRLRAIDETQHGGFYCLVVDDLATDNKRSVSAPRGRAPE